MTTTMTQYHDETRRDFRPLRLSSEAPRYRRFRRPKQTKEEREARVAALEAYYNPGGAGWEEAFAGALAVFLRYGRTERALERAAQAADWEVADMERFLNERGHVVVRPVQS